jgi:hypothetical protein
MVEREVALTLCVTETPKKLKPLVAEVISMNLTSGDCRLCLDDLPDADHDEKAGYQHGLVRKHLTEPLHHIKHAEATGIGASNG